MVWQSSLLIASLYPMVDMPESIPGIETVWWQEGRDFYGSNGDDCIVQ